MPRVAPLRASKPPASPAERPPGSGGALGDARVCGVARPRAAAPNLHRVRGGRRPDPGRSARGARAGLVRSARAGAAAAAPPARLCSSRKRSSSGRVKPKRSSASCRTCGARAGGRALRGRDRGRQGRARVPLRPRGAPAAGRDRRGRRGVGCTRPAGAALDFCRQRAACHGAIRAHQALTREQMERLLQQLDACANLSHCPHGRPTWLKWDTATIERSFRRTV